MSSPRLSRSGLRRARPDAAGPLPDPGSRVGIVHLGLGAFHRAHQAVLTHEAMLAEPGDWAVCAVSQRSPVVARALADQDGLFSVAELGTADERLRVIGSIGATLFAPEQPEELADAIAAPGSRIVSLTVTEAGYRHDLRTGRLRRDDPETAADIGGRAPRTPIGQLVRGIERRRRRDSGALTVLCCDNLPDNGALVASLVHEFCDAAGSPDLAEWIERHVAFPSTVVDQIVPAPTETDRARAAARLGLVDRAAVGCEEHRTWVIEDRFAGPRPAWERVGARLVPDVRPYQAAKLRLVNGTHSALAYLGMLAGHRSVAEVLAREEFARYAAALLRRETGPSLARFGRSPAPADIEAVLTRLANPRMTHLLAQIGADGPRKLPQRLLEPAAELISAGREPRLICLALAAWPHTGQGSAADLESLLPAAARDPMRALLAEAAGRLRRDGVAATLRREVAD